MAINKFDCDQLKNVETAPVNIKNKPNVNNEIILFEGMFINFMN
jgi:hypothetical protein